MNTEAFIDADFGHQSKKGQIVCGDVFLSEKLKNENRLIAVLSDGLGSGIKANILAGLTASMALNFTKNDQPIERSSASIRETLPVCNVRKIAFATFTIVDTEFDGLTRIIEYGNRQFLVFRKSNVLNPDTDINPETDISVSEFKAEIEDRIILFSDGVSQSGIGTPEHPFGWNIEGMTEFIEDILEKIPQISSEELRNSIMNKAMQHDRYKPQDDISCAVLYFRKPRNLILCSGPPFDKNKDSQMVKTVTEFDGCKVICGGTTAKIFSREMNKHIDMDIFNVDPDLPPISKIEGIDLITEGILTLGKAAEMLENKSCADFQENNPARQLIETLLAYDEITFLIGTRINETLQDPNMPVELEIRRNVIKKIAHLLEKNYLKETEILFI